MTQEEERLILNFYNKNYIGFTAIQGDYDFSNKLLQKATEMGVNSRVALSEVIDDDLYLKEIMSL